jgi:hypothetical protein
MNGEAVLGHKVITASRRCNIILYCEMVDRDLRDSNHREDWLERVRSNF